MVGQALRKYIFQALELEVENVEVSKITFTRSHDVLPFPSSMCYIFATCTFCECKKVWGNEPSHSQVSSHFGSWGSGGFLNL